MQLQEQYYRQPPSYNQVRGGLFALKQRYPQLCRVFTIGRSALGREIYAMAVGETACATLYVGGTHGQEWITSLLMLRFLDDLLTSIAQNEQIAEIDVKKCVAKRGVVVVPVLNPDGIEIALCGAAGAGFLGEQVSALCGGNFALWQANARGVDLNHNFNAGWEVLHRMEEDAGIVGPSPTRFGGFAPESEPETRALCAFCRQYPMRQAYAFHAQGEEIFFRYGQHTPARSRLMAQMLAVSSGYRLVTQAGLASHGGFKDWFIEELHRPAFTVEIGRGKNPLPVEQLIPIHTRLREMLSLALLL